MHGSDFALTRQPRTAPDHVDEPGCRLWRAIRGAEPAVLVLLLLVVLATFAVAGTLRVAATPSGAALSSQRLAQQYNTAADDLGRLDLLRHRTILGEPVSAERSIVAARFDREARALVEHNALRRAGEDVAGDDANFAKRVAAFQGAEQRWVESPRRSRDDALDHVVTALHASLLAEVTEHESKADADTGRRSDRLVALQRGVVPALALMLLTGAVAARTAARRRQQLLTATAITEWNSLHDPMTGLPNRLALSNEIEGLNVEDSVALVWIDLDGFKAINDSLGHAYGDLVLGAVAERLLDVVRPDDFVARIGGDEFVVLCTGLGTPESALQLARRVTAAIRRPLALARGFRVVTASIGVAVADGGAADDLFAAADTAMYQAKRLGHGGVALFDEHLRVVEAERTTLGLDLGGAAGRGEFRLYYQPLVDLRAGHVRGVEALVRWQHPTLGLLTPDAFIDVAEETGSIIELGDWVLNEACRVLAAWETSSPAPHSLRISVNVSTKQIAAGSLVDSVKRALSSSGANPALLTIEVTESAVMADVTAATRTLRELRDMGIHLAIDDFGTGYSSLTYLKQFPIHELKLDKSFVDGVGTNAEDSAIVAAVVNLARAVSLEVVAEGVESIRQSAVLRTLGCDFGQGYLWQRPARLTSSKPGSGCTRRQPGKRLILGAATTAKTTPRRVAQPDLPGIYTHSIACVRPLSGAGSVDGLACERGRTAPARLADAPVRCRPVRLPGDNGPHRDSYRPGTCARRDAPNSPAAATTASARAA